MDEKAPTALSKFLSLVLRNGDVSRSGPPPRIEHAWAIAIIVGAVVVWVSVRNFTAAEAEPDQPVRLVTQLLPGMLIDLPEGSKGEVPAAYSRGLLLRGKGSPFGIVAVRWAAGSPIDDRTLDLAIAASLPGLGGKPEEVERNVAVSVPGGLAARSWSLVTPSRVAWTTYVACGGRQVTIMSMGPPKGIPGLHRRIASSFRCHPDPAKEADLDDVPVIFDVPSGWRQMPGGPRIAQVNITDRDHLLMAGVALRRLEPDQMVESMRDGGLLGPDVRLGPRQGDDVSFLGTRGGKPVGGWLRWLQCPGLAEPIWLASMSKGGPEEAAKGLALLRKTRCRTPAEPPQKWPQTSLGFP